MIVTIDGPAGAGKSTAAKALAQRLGFEFLDTGAMYRAVTLAAIRAGVDLLDREGLTRVLTLVRLEMKRDRVFLNGEDVSGLIRTSKITTASSAVADNPAVRRRLVEWQRQIADGRDMVCEGRDQGTIVFPEAQCKFFLVADPVERARRRQRDLAARGEHIPWEELLEAQEIRDNRDTARDIAPMIPAKDSIVLDSTARTLDDVVSLMEQVVKNRQAL